MSDASPLPHGEPGTSPQANIYDRLGVKTLINAAGTFTEFGGSLMPPAVLAAQAQAARHFVDLRELQTAVGHRLAGLLRVEAALVTAGAASGILLGTAAAITVRAPEFTQLRTPESDRAAAALPWEVMRQSGQRNLYDRQIEMCGARIVDVASASDVAQAVNERTVMMMAYNCSEPQAPLQHAEWLSLAQRFGLPTLLDAAADIPPVENLWRFNHLGYDMVVFSGGKALRGPQGSGLLLGRADLIAAAQRNAVPNEGTVGRVAKVSKEDIVGLWQAVELFLASGDNLIGDCERRLSGLERVLCDIPSLVCRRIVPPVANRFPHLLLEWEEQQLGVSRGELKAQLVAGSPSIVTGRVEGTGESGFLISVINLQPGEEDVVAHRIKHILLSGHFRKPTACPSR